MRWSHYYNFLFFANPKTGSDAARKVLDPYAFVKSVRYSETTLGNPFYSHIRPVEVRDIFWEWGWDFDRYFKFTFTRNPWARLVSLYAHQFRNLSPSKWKKTGKVFKRACRGQWGKAGKAYHQMKMEPPPFKEWLREIRPEGVGGGGLPHERWKRYGAYSLSAFAGDEAGNLLVDQVVKLEEAYSEMPRILRHLGVPAENAFPVTNRSPHPAYRDFYDRESKNWVFERYREEIEMFDYRF